MKSVILTVFAHLLLMQPALADRTLEGRVTVVRNVDTIIVAGTPIRLNRVDGPETSTRNGRDLLFASYRSLHRPSLPWGGL